MFSSTVAVALLALAQTPEAPQTETQQAVHAAQQAAQAAQKAAEAAERAAEAAAKAAGAPAPAAAPAAAPADAKTGDSSLVSHWSGLVGVGLIALQGNSESLTATLNAQADVKLGEWALGLRANGAYGQTIPSEGADAQLTALKASGVLRGDRNIADFATLFILGGLETDHIKSVQARGFGEVGSGIRFYEKKEGDLERVFIRGDVAFRYSRESRFQYISSKDVPAGTFLPAVTLVAPRFALVFRYALNKDIRFSEEAEILPNLLGDPRLLINSTTKLSARLTQTFSISGGYVLTFDSAPAPGKKTADGALTLGLEAAF